VELGTEAARTDTAAAAGGARFEAPADRSSAEDGTGEQAPVPDVASVVPSAGLTTGTGDGTAPADTAGAPLGEAPGSDERPAGASAPLAGSVGQAPADSAASGPEAASRSHDDEAAAPSEAADAGLRPERGDAAMEAFSRKEDGTRVAPPSSGPATPSPAAAVAGPGSDAPVSNEASPTDPPAAAWSPEGSPQWAAGFEETSSVDLGASLGAESASEDEVPAANPVPRAPEAPIGLGSEAAAPGERPAPQSQEGAGPETPGSGPGAGPAEAAPAPHHSPDESSPAPSAGRASWTEALQADGSPEPESPWHEPAMPSMALDEGVGPSTGASGGPVASKPGAGQSDPDDAATAPGRSRTGTDAARAMASPAGLRLEPTDWDEGDGHVPTDVSPSPRFEPESSGAARDTTDFVSNESGEHEPVSPIDLEMQRGFSANSDVLRPRDPKPLGFHDDDTAPRASGFGRQEAKDTLAADDDDTGPRAAPAPQASDASRDDDTAPRTRRAQDITELSPRHRAPSAPPPPVDSRREEVPASAMELPPVADAAPPAVRERGSLRRETSGVRVQGMPAASEASPAPDGPDAAARPALRRPVVERQQSGESARPVRPVGHAEPPSTPAPHQSSTDVPAGAAVAVGVEFGARSIRIGRFERKEFRAVGLPTGHPLPGLVFVRQDGTLKAGPRARVVAETEPQRCVSVLELLMAVQEGKITRKDLPLLGWGPEGGLVQIHGYRFEIYELLLELMRGVKDLIDRELQSTPYRVFLGLPAGLDPLAGSLLRNALKEVGMKLAESPGLTESHVAAFHLEDEPIDSALLVMVDELSVGIGVVKRTGAQGLRTVFERRYDDVSARVLDDAVVELTLRSLLQQAGEDHRQDPASVVRVREAFAVARQDLRRTPTVELKVSLPAPGGAANVTLDRTIQLARSRIYGVGETIVNQLHDHVTGALSELGIAPHSIGMVLLSGEGASYPPFGQMLAQLTGKEPSMMMPATTAYVQGLARWGRAHEQRNIARRPDTLDASIGIELPGQRFRPLLAAGTRLPTVLKRSQPIRDSQSELELRLHQGEGETIRGCTPLGSIALRDLPKGTSRKVELSLEVDASGILTVTLLETKSGRTVEQTFATAQTPPEVRRPVPVTTAEPGPSPGPADDGPKSGLLGRLFGKRP